MTTTQRTTDGTTMQAITQDHYGEPEDVLRLEEIARPAIGDEEVLLRVHTAGVDRGVWHLITGLPYPVRLAGYGIRAPKTRVPGREVAGRVEATGLAVTALHVGDEVFGIADGSFAEYASARPSKLAPKPAVRLSVPRRSGWRSWDLSVPGCRCLVPGRGRGAGLLCGL
jgi:NADPH:quinone reductase-like Zn-dependent oxidoreductase